MKWLTIFFSFLLTIGCQCPVCPGIPPDDSTEPPMGTTDWAASANGASVDSSYGFSSPGNAIDSNDVTYSQVVFPYEVGVAWIQVAFSQAFSITQFRVISSGSMVHGIVLSYYDGSWHTLEVWGAPQAKTTKTWDYPNGLANVSKVKIEIEGALNSARNIFTLNAYGNYYIDKGLRVEQTGADTRSVAVETLASDHKLRVRINGVTYGVPMVSTTHAQAAAVRIYDGSAVKSLVDITP